MTWPVTNPASRGGEERDDGGRIGRLADPAEGERRARLSFLFGCHLPERTGRRAARPHRVDRDPAGRELGRCDTPRV